MKRTTRRLERKYHISYSCVDRQNWIQQLKEQDIFIRTKEHLYWSAQIASNLWSPKRLWRDLDLLMRKSDDVASTSSADVQEAESFAHFFYNKVCQIQKLSEDALAGQFDDQTEFTLLNFQQIMPEQVIHLITAAPNKSCVLDPAPIFVVKEMCLAGFTIYITHFNQSISESYLPPSQKAAIVTPITKKRDLDKADLKNFRIVSNLTLLSKLLERDISRQLTDFLATNNLFPASQSAYQKFHSTESALLKVDSNICDALSDGNIVLLGLLDLSVAFDTVDYHILLQQLESSFGITGSSLEWTGFSWCRLTDLDVVRFISPAEFHKDPCYDLSYLHSTIRM